jgi:putative nucleotidyltransferase with HDIG domain
LADIKAKRIKRISVKAFKDDPLRMMRAFSLSASLGFKIERETLAQIRREKDLIRRVSYERVREELFKVLESGRAAEILRLMDTTGLLAEVIPQVRVMSGCKQGTYHHLDVWPHSLETVAQVEKILEEVGASVRMKGYLDERIGGEHSRRAVLKLACLLHDIGKPDTRKREQSRLTFHAHERVGKNITTHVGKMLKLSTKERHVLEDMVLWHLRPGYLSNFKKPGEKSIYRYFRDTKDEAVSILLLSWADQRSTRGPLTSEADQRHHEGVCRDLMERYFKMKDEKPFVCLIDGHDLIKTFKLKPSPLFGEILFEVAEQQALGKVKTKTEALELVREIAVKE